MSAPRKTRYQAAILRGDQILMIRHREHADGRTYWVLPGGGIEAGESVVVGGQERLSEGAPVAPKVVERARAAGPEGDQS